MLKITIPKSEQYNALTNEFVYTDEQTLSLEHSLVSISKWESKWNVPFLNNEKTLEQTIDYIKCMTITQNVDPLVYNSLTDDNIEEINKYIEAPMTATTFSNLERPNGREVITSEIIYFWMIDLKMPFECQKWHLNRLLTLIKVCYIKQSKGKKMSKNDILRQNAELNKARRKKLNSKG